MSGIPMMIGGHKSNWVVTGMFSTRGSGSHCAMNDLRARDPTDQLVEGPYCQTEVVQDEMGDNQMLRKVNCKCGGGSGCCMVGKTEKSILIATVRGQLMAKVKQAKDMTV
ncbi:hypothetical protein BY996DRAFT_6409790 [Phakopsora pachyrhizi]|nr:hypothetical protein BY996DRAFT_6409790 [Phakopsora pachyrhizi]